MNKKIEKKRKRLLIDLVSQKNYRPMRKRDIAVLLEVPKSRRADLYQLLDDLEAEGRILCRDGKYQRAEERGNAKIKDAKRGDAKGRNAKAGDVKTRDEKRQEKKKKKETRGTVLEGVFLANARGFGFVETADGESDVYIAPEDTGGAFHKDQVEIALSPQTGGGRREGRVVRILSHGITEVVGTFVKSGNFGFVIPDNKKLAEDIFIAKEHVHETLDQDKVVARLLSYGGVRRKPEGEIAEILGAKGDVGIDVLSIARDSDLPMEFPVRVMHQAERVPDHLIENDYQGRMDLRGLVTVTIDGDDAKDLDDAVSLTQEGDHYRLGVHIADVSNYVQGRSALDREALKRGTSVYMVDRVIPMLPQRLSNGICSLNQGEDRLTLSCLMEIDAKGRVVDYRICESVIRVDRRMTYRAVQAILDGDSAQQKAYGDLVPLFFRMRELSALIRKNRKSRGAVDFNFPESEVFLNELGRPIAIAPHEANDATRLIEDFMLLANETVAAEFCRKGIPFVYRTHENPDGEKIEKMLTQLRSLGVRVRKSGQSVTPAEVQKILGRVSGDALEPMVSRMLLRSMKQARYTTECTGHFGLAAKYYCHFTSPIRRYPDLQIHRIIKDVLRGRMTAERKKYYAGILDEVAAQSSMCERRAQDVERETVKLKMAEYMRDHIGESFEGTISGVTGWGVYVELPNTVEGLVRVSQMRDDYYIYDEEKNMLTGERTKKTYRLGDTVRICVSGADIEEKTIDFVMMEEGDDGKGKRKPSDRK